MKSVFQEVTDFTLVRSSADMPETAREWAALLLMDTLGIAMAASSMDAGVIAKDTAHALFGASRPEMSARMLLDGRKVSLAGAA